MQYEAVNPGSTGAGVGEVCTTHAGNIVIRVGRVNTSVSEYAAGWSQTEYVVLDPETALALAGDITAQALDARRDREKVPSDTSLRPRPGETAQQTVDRAIGAAQKEGE